MSNQTTELDVFKCKIVIFAILFYGNIILNTIFGADFVSKKNIEPPTSIQTFTDSLDNSGKVNIIYHIKIQKPFFIQAFILYDENWRTIPVFFNQNRVWIDLGPRYKKIPYIINILIL